MKNLKNVDNHSLLAVLTVKNIKLRTVRLILGKKEFKGYKSVSGYMHTFKIFSSN